jgi:formamidopyrimidine-DNA glycosylase
MPELPEVETVVRSLRPALVGRTILSVWSSGKPLRMRRKLDEPALVRACRSARVRAISRRAKYILIELERSGQESSTVVVHLGMTGRLRVESALSPRARHTHVVWELSDGSELRFVDPRRFGWVAFATGLQGLPELARLGPDAHTQTDVGSLAAALARSSAPIKSFLLDQRRIAGLGNIYVCEALFRAGIHPRTKARRAQRKSELLAQAIRETLDIGIANCGTSFRDFVDANGAPGRNMQALLVYGREGEPCKTCGSSIRREADAGRSTFFCGHCQKR